MSRHTHDSSNESCHTYMSHVTHICHTNHMPYKSVAIVYLEQWRFLYEIRSLKWIKLPLCISRNGAFCMAYVFHIYGIPPKILLVEVGCRPAHQKNQRVLTPAHPFWYKSKMRFSSDLTVQIKQNGGYGVETPQPGRFSGGLLMSFHF